MAGTGSAVRALRHAWAFGPQWNTGVKMCPSWEESKQNGAADLSCMVLPLYVLTLCELCFGERHPFT